MSGGRRVEKARSDSRNKAHPSDVYLEHRGRYARNFYGPVRKFCNVRGGLLEEKGTQLFLLQEALDSVTNEEQKELRPLFLSPSAHSNVAELSHRAIALPIRE